jgi:hypothetical protein
MQPRPDPSGTPHPRLGIPLRMHSSTITKTPGDLGFKWWQVLGSNQRRLNRRFTARRSQPIGIATDLPFLYFRHVNTAFCARGVRSPGVCLVSATQVLDHVPSSPAASHRPAAVLDPAGHAAKPSACRSRCPPLPPTAHAPDSVPPQKSDLQRFVRCQAGTGR